MKMKPFTNDTDRVIYLGNATIPPGQTRDVEETLHPDFAAEPKATAATEAADPLVDLLKGNTTSIKAALADLSEGELERLGDLEQAAAQPRKGVLGAIAEQILALGQKKADSDAAAGQDGNPPGDGGTDKQGDE